MMRKSNGPTLNDVALRAGVNKVTASIVLSGGQGNTRVSEATRQRIHQAAGELQYLPNALARSLRHRKTNIIGFYMGGYIDMRDLFLSEILSGLQQGCEQNRRDFMMHGTFIGPSTDEVYAELLNGKVDGLVLHVPTCDPLLPRLAASRLPVVAIANPVADLPSVTVDDIAGSRLMAEHLAQRGHKRIVYAACPFLLSSSDRRCKAFCESAEEYNLEVIIHPARTVDTLPSEMELEYLATPATQRPTAVACWNDNFAYLMIEHFRTHGVRVPNDLAVIGFDGSTTLIPPAYRLTTIQAPWREVARTAVTLLSQTADKPAPEETVLPVRFFQGETT